MTFYFPAGALAAGGKAILSAPPASSHYPELSLPLCPRCGRPQSRAILCPGCAGWQAEIDGIRSPFRFDGVIRQAIHELKYRNLRAIAGLFARLLNDYLVANPVPAEVVVAVPLHPKRLRERGYNQSQLLAQGAGFTHQTAPRGRLPYPPAPLPTPGADSHR